MKFRRTMPVIGQDEQQYGSAISKWRTTTITGKVRTQSMPIPNESNEREKETTIETRIGKQSNRIRSSGRQRGKQEEMTGGGRRRKKNRRERKRSDKRRNDDCVGE